MATGTGKTFTLALADIIERQYDTARIQVEKLPQAILAKAFRGELVPTEAELARAEGRTYETAEALLARIRGEQGAGSGEAAQTSRRGRGASKRGR